MENSTKTSHAAEVLNDFNCN